MTVSECPCRLAWALYVQSHTLIRELLYALLLSIEASSFDLTIRGNWSVDLQAGSQFGYRPLLFIVLLAGLGAIILQVSAYGNRTIYACLTVDVIFQSLACKLGCVTGIDLATHCRLLLHDRPKHQKLVRYGALYPLYILCEIAIISTDLAELLGSAIGLCLLFPQLPLWAGVLVTAGDVLVFLVFGAPSRYGKPVRAFEITIVLLVSIHSRRNDPD